MCSVVADAHIKYLIVIVTFLSADKLCYLFKLEDTTAPHVISADMTSSFGGGAFFKRISYDMQFYYKASLLFPIVNFKQIQPNV